MQQHYYMTNWTPNITLILHEIHKSSKTQYKQGNQRWQTSPAAPPVCVPNFIVIGWEMAEILHFEILRKHGQTHRQTDRHGHYNTSPSPYGGRGKNDTPNSNSWAISSEFWQKYSYPHVLCDHAERLGVGYGRSKTQSSQLHHTYSYIRILCIIELFSCCIGMLANKQVALNRDGLAHKRNFGSAKLLMKYIKIGVAVNNVMFSTRISTHFQ